MQVYDEQRVSHDRDGKQNAQKLERLALKPVHILPGEGDESYELALCRREVGPYHAHRNSELFLVLFELDHLCLSIHLQVRSPFEDDRTLFDLHPVSQVVRELDCLLDHRNRLPGQSTLINQSASLENDSVEGQLQLFVQKHNIPRHNVE